MPKLTLGAEAHRTSIAPKFSFGFKFLTEFKVGLFKDCETSCNTPNCNANNEVELLYSDRDENGDPRDLHCYEYAMDKLSEGGLSSYEDDNVPNSDWYIRKCPRWANQGCFRGNQIWQVGSNPFNFQNLVSKFLCEKIDSKNARKEADSATHSIRDVPCSR